MTPFDRKTKEEWTEILDSVWAECGMPASLRDETGNVLMARGEQYPLCAEIRADGDALKFICAQTNTAMLHEVKSGREPLIDLCEAGLIRMVVPLLEGDTLIGYVAACGKASADDEVETFLVSKQLGVSESRAQELAASTPVASVDDFQALAQRLFKELNFA